MITCLAFLQEFALHCVCEHIYTAWIHLGVIKMGTSSHPQRKQRAALAPPDPTLLSPARLSRASMRADSIAVGAAKDIAHQRLEPKLKQLLASLNRSQHAATFEAEELTLETLKTMTFAELRTIFPAGMIPAGRMKSLLECCSDPDALQRRLADTTIGDLVSARPAAKPQHSPSRSHGETPLDAPNAQPAEQPCFLANAQSGIVHASPDGKRRLCTGMAFHSAIQVASPSGWTVCDHPSERCRRFMEQARGSADR